LLDDPGKAVVAAPLLRIRITSPDRILPEYLNWYISQRDAQVFFNSSAKGTLQKMISKQAIEELEISLPSLAPQDSRKKRTIHILDNNEVFRRRII
jgi:restriction endonuclease S subunit